jgi:hypothetical protein
MLPINNLCSKHDDQSPLAAKALFVLKDYKESTSWNPKSENDSKMNS